MTVSIGVMGSAGDSGGQTNKEALAAKANALALAIAQRQLHLLTGATTGIVYVVGKAAHDAGALHIGVSPACDEHEHVEKYQLPLDACDRIIFTGFGLKGRNVVLVRSCDVVIFIAGSMGSLNEFTIAHDEGKVIGCLTGTGGVADEVDYLLSKFSKKTDATIFRDDDPGKLIDACLSELQKRAVN
jgi:uncharacterized protein (TIGR00725 family)